MIADIPCDGTTYAEAIRHYHPAAEAIIRVDFCNACADQTIYYCLTHLHWHSLFKIFSLGAGAVCTLLLLVTPYIIWKLR